jgi:signal transduction histidine kinase
LKVYAQLVGRRLASLDDKHGVDLIGKIDGAVDRLAALVSDITAYGRPPEVKREPTDPDEIVSESLGLVQDRIENGRIRVVYEAAPGLGLLPLDPREIRKAVMNTLVNALDAMPEGGTLTILTSQADGVFTIAISDTGEGMDEATCARTFDLFFTTKRGGTGLGMAIIRSAVERHGGRLSIESAPGRGTTVSMTIPT